jgi:hypothetical protein
MNSSKFHYSAFLQRQKIITRQKLSQYLSSYHITEKVEPTPAASRTSSDETRQSPEDVEKNGVETVDGEGDSNIVWWDGDNDPANPMNWSTAKKWTNVGIVSAITFIVFVTISFDLPFAPRFLFNVNNH